MLGQLYRKYKSLINNIFSLGLLKVIDLFVPLLLFPYLVAVVGEEKYGVYAFGYTLIFYFLNLTQYGFSLSAVKAIALVKEDKQELNKVFNEIFSTKMFLTFISLSAITILVVIVPQFRENYEIFFFLSFILLGDTLTSTWYFQGIEKMQFITLINFVSKLSFVVMVALWIKQEDDYIFIGLYHAAGYILAGLITMGILIKKFDVNIYWVSLKKIKKQLQISFNSFLILITPTLYSSTSILMLGFFSSYQYVTFLEAGMKISGMFSGANSILTIALYPFVNRNKKYKKKSIKLLLATGVLFSVVMYLTANLIVNFWLKSPNQEIIIVIKLLSLSPFMLSVISAFGINKLLVEDKDKLFLKVTIIASTSGLIIGVFLIKYYELFGAALTIIITRSLYALLTYINEKNLNEKIH